MTLDIILVFLFPLLSFQVLFSFLMLQLVSFEVAPTKYCIHGAFPLFFALECSKESENHFYGYDCFEENLKESSEVINS